MLGNCQLFSRNAILLCMFCIKNVSSIYRSSAYRCLRLFYFFNIFFRDHIDRDTYIDFRFLFGLMLYMKYTFVYSVVCIWISWMNLSYSFHEHNIQVTKFKIEIESIFCYYHHDWCQWIQFFYFTTTYSYTYIHIL